MTTKHIVPSIEPIEEDSEDELKGPFKSTEERSTSDTLRQQYRAAHDAAMFPTKANTSKERERERSRRSHRSSASGSKHASKPKAKNTSARRASFVDSRERERDVARGNGSDASRSRHRRSHSGRDTSPSSSSDEEQQSIQQQRVSIVAARARLTSPSTLSTLTSLTSSTNKSSGSSGSNSTVTQASITRQSTPGKKPEMPEVPMSPAVPDPPDVFAFLENNGSAEYLEPLDKGEESEEDEEESQEPQKDEEQEVDHESTPWMPGQIDADFIRSSLPSHVTKSDKSTSSSASSSFHGDDNFSEPPAEADHDTDRSSSPERSDQEQEIHHETPRPTDNASAKVASQLAAAQQRQNLHSSMQSFGTPNMQRGAANLPHVPSTALSSKYQQQVKQRPLPRAEKLPVTGYELLASQLSSHAPSMPGKGGRIKPMYRKFEALNHRLLLHLQDEISELEEQLHRLDNADTQTRRTERHIIPASRRASAAAGGELQWHKTDILGKIGYKLAQYNQALASFNTTQSLSPPDPEDISTYRDYLQKAHPIVEAETHFLDPADDLVSIYSDHAPAPESSYTPSSASSCVSSTVVAQAKPSSTSDVVDIVDCQSNPTALAVAVAVAVLLPILTFSVIPGFVGRITVTSLVACGVLGAAIQGGVVESGIILMSEGIVCAGIYGAAMFVVAGIMPG